ncbi:hypothetical protein BH09SUM1_BH09SUM1_25640 [soil metagenome]
MQARRGFTLIELLIVVAIIAILAAIAVPNFLEAQTRAKVSRAKADLRSLALALESYAVDNNRYPYSQSINASIWLPPGGYPRNFPDRCGGVTSPIAYITTIPVDIFSHAVLDSGGLPTGEVAPIYYEKAGFGYKDAVKGDMAVQVPQEAVGTNSLTGSGPDTPVTDQRLTPAAYALYSLGPDKNPHVVDGAGTVITRSRYSILNRYDPTNGTISTGNVVRFPSGQSFP